MASIVQGLVNAQLASSATTLYTAPTGTWVQLTKILLTNTSSASSIAVTIYLVPFGGSAGTTHLTTDGQALLPLQSWNSPNEYGLVLNPGDFISAFAATAATVNIFIAGALFT